MLNSTVYRSKKLAGFFASSFWTASPTPLAFSSVPCKRSLAAQQEQFQSGEACRQINLKPISHDPLLHVRCVLTASPPPWWLALYPLMEQGFLASWEPSLQLLASAQPASPPPSSPSSYVSISFHCDQVSPMISGYSVITGIGFGLMYIPSIVIVSR